MTNKLFCFGLGYSAMALVELLRPLGWQLAGTVRSEAKAEALRQQGIDAHLFDGTRPLDHPQETLAGATHVLVSIAPQDGQDPVVTHHAGHLAACWSIAWVGYLSTTGVYGNHDGGWVDENTPRSPTGPRAKARKDAEDAWLALWRDQGVPVHIFRLAGIYGPGRSALDTIRSGRARRIDKPGQVFSRIHVEDIANVLHASINKPNPGVAYNVCDDNPAPPAEVIEYAAQLLGVEPPPLIPFDQAELSPMARSFYADNKRVRNDRIREELGVQLAFPDYQQGLEAQLADEQA